MTSITVVVPTLGRIKRLRRALESVANQTQLPDNLVVVDGSSDRSAEPVLNDLDLPFETIYIHQTGTGGLSEARNLGIAASDSELLAFIDDDDQWRPEKLASQVAMYEQTGAGLIFCGVKNILSDGTVTNIKRPNSAPDAESILTGNSIGTPSAVLVRRVDVEVIGGFDEELPTREEWDFYIRLLQETEATELPEPLVLKEYNPDGISRNVEHAERDLMRVFEKHREKYEVDTEVQFRANYHFELGRQYAKVGETAYARTHLRRSLTYVARPSLVAYYAAACLGPRGYTIIRKLFQRLSVVYHST